MSVFKTKATSGGGSETAPAGNHPAVLVALIDLGTHEEEYQGKKSDSRKLFFVWELTGEKIAGIDRNHTIGKAFNLSFGKKSNLRKMAETWRGKEFADGEDFDISKMLGKSCLLTISHKTSSNDKTYAKIDAVAPVPKGMQVPKPLVTPFLWELTGDDPIPEQDWLPFIFGRSVKDTIEASAEFKAGGNGQAAQTVPAESEEEFDRF